MSKSIYFLLLLIVTSTIFVGCKKDKDDDNNSNDTETKKNYFSYDNTEYDLTQSFTVGNGEVKPGIYSMNFMCASEGLIFHEIDGQVDSASGIGNIIIFEVYTSQATTLDIGDYTFGDDITYEVKNIFSGTALLGYDTQIEEATRNLIIESGDLKVISNGSTFEFEFDVIDDEGKHIKGYYKGVSKYYDESDDKGEKNFF